MNHLSNPFLTKKEQKDISAEDAGNKDSGEYIRDELLHKQSINNGSDKTSEDDGFDVDQNHVIYIEVLGEIFIDINFSSPDNHRNDGYDRKDEVIVEVKLADVTNPQIDDTPPINQKESCNMTDDQQLVLESMAVDDAVYDLD